MPRYILKPKPDEDFYVTYSTIVDAPVLWGTRDEIWHEDPDAFRNRLDRADETGSSAMWPRTGAPYMGWDETEIIVREGFAFDDVPDGAIWGVVARSDLRALCESRTADGHWNPRAVQVTWECSDDPEDDDRPEHDQTSSCCPEHGTHMPHRGCILR